MSSRIIVKNLPGHVTETRLRDVFGEKGTVTDLKLMYTRAGVFRRFAFVGFASAEEAKNAVNYFDKSFIDTSRIVVEEAKSLDDPSLSRPWSIYSAGSSAYRKSLAKSGKQPVATEKKVSDKADSTKCAEEEKDENAKVIEQLAQADKDQKLQEFLHSMSSRAKKQVWSNDDEGLAFTVNSATVKKGASEPKDEMPNTDKQGDLGEGKGDLDSEGSDVITKTGDGDCQNDSAESDENASLIIETGRLFIRNLCYGCTEEQLRSFYEKFGTLSDVHISIDTSSKQSKGLGFVTFLIPEQAVKAYLATDGMSFQGRLLHVLPGKALREIDNSDKGGKSFKKQKEEKMKSEASMDYNWNTLFLRSDTVADAISSKLDIQKGDLFNIESDSMAVRLALSETHIIADTKKYLEEEGVVMEGLKKNVRSKTNIIVKNIPHSTTETDLFDTFSKHGAVTRVILPPTKTIAIVIFSEAAEARSAFRKLAYSKFNNVPLYLEWAPENMVTDNIPSKNEKNSEEAKVGEEAATKRDFKRALEADTQNEEISEGYSTVFAKNLNFNTTEDSLRSLFEDIGTIRSVTIAKKKDPKNPGKMLSMGFGFVEYESKDVAMECIKKRQNCMLDGHQLELKLSTRTSNKSNKAVSKGSSKSGKGTKLHVKNVPFEATLSELKTLFGTFGQFKNLRLPKKFDGQHRGFCFVDYLTKQEAKNAFDALSSTHLYGRHLVIEWAEEEQSIEALREKTEGMYNALENSSVNKKRKIEMPAPA